ncbi:MAG: nitroreductase [Rhodospirillales bacterium]|nr:nitroreductase [Rhodospirillales bacterium]MDE2199229.1 nitroreductase [Rhodospirillales bacterium]MDE2573701.1 nitroreductase [Rhodospirillales bacterium]
MNDAISTVTAGNAVESAILSRRSVRGYLSTPVARETVAHLLDVAARAPSGTNMQPWRVTALAGEALARFCAGVAGAYASGAEADNLETRYYPTPLPEPWLSRRRRIGWDLYGLLGIARGETAKMRAHVERNLHYFGAPVGLICTIDRRLLIGSWIDYGMFLENICIAARARGLDTCAMAVFAEFPRTVRALLDLPESDIVVCGMAIGHEDPAAPANQLRTVREPAATFTDFRGF